MQLFIPFGDFFTQRVDAKGEKEGRMGGREASVGLPDASRQVCVHTVL